VATLNNVRDLSCAEFGLDIENVGWMMRSLRSAGLLRKGKGGNNAVNAPQADERACIIIMLGAVSSEGAVGAAGDVAAFEALPLTLDEDGMIDDSRTLSSFLSMLVSAIRAGREHGST
jgi:hypothetical protein